MGDRNSEIASFVAKNVFEIYECKGLQRIYENAYYEKNYAWISTFFTKITFEVQLFHVLLYAFAHFIINLHK